MTSFLCAKQVSFVADMLHGPLSVEAKVRYRSPAARALLRPNETHVQVEFESPQRAIAPGQAVVFFKGEEVLGGGIIEAPCSHCQPSLVKTKSGPSDTG